MGDFDDLIPTAEEAKGAFADLIPAPETARGAFIDLVPDEAPATDDFADNLAWTLAKFPNIAKPDATRMVAEKLRRRIPESPTTYDAFKSTVSELPGEVAKGFLKSAVTAPLRFVSRAGQQFTAPESFGPEDENLPHSPAPLERFANAVDRSSEIAFPAPDQPGLEHAVAQGAGQIGSLFAGAGALKAAGAGEQVIAGSIVAQGGVNEFDDAFGRAIARGDDADTAFAKSLGYATVAGLIENRFGAGRLWRQMFPSAEAAAKKLTALGVTKTIGANILAGGAEEGSQRFAQNLIIDEKPSLEGVMDEAIPGAILEGAAGLPGGVSQNLAAHEQFQNEQARAKALEAHANESALQASLPIQNGTLTANRAADESFVKGAFDDLIPAETLSQSQPPESLQNSDSEFGSGTQKPPEAVQATSPAPAASPEGTPNLVRGALDAAQQSGTLQQIAQAKAETQRRAEVQAAGKPYTTEQALADLPNVVADLKAMIESNRLKQPAEIKPELINSENNNPQAEVQNAAVNPAPEVSEANKALDFVAPDTAATKIEIKPGDTVSVVTRKNAKPRNARVVQMQPDGSAQVVVAGEQTARWLTKDQVQPSRRAVTQQAKADELAGFKPEQQTQIKERSAEFRRLVADYAPQLEWSPAEAYDDGGGTDTKDVGFQKAALRNKAIAQALRTVLPGGQVNSLVDQANALPALERYLKEQFPGDNSVAQRRVLEDFGRSETNPEQAASLKRDQAVLNQLAARYPGKTHFQGLRAVSRSTPRGQSKLDAKSGGKSRGKGALPAAGAAAVTELERIFGVRIIFVHDAKFAGVKPAGVKLVLINTKAKAPMMALAGHELLHHIASTQPTLYADFKQRAVSLLKNNAQFREDLASKGYTDLTDDVVTEEMFADVLGDAVLDPVFLKQLAQSEPNLFKRFARSAVTWLQKLIAKAKGLMGFDSAQYVTDLEAMRHELVNLLREAGQQTQFEKAGIKQEATETTEQGQGQDAFARQRMEFSNATITAPGLVDLGDRFSLTAHHGTPHKVDKFTTAKIGTGEGAQAYGWGLYFAENEKIAEYYKKNLTEREFISKVRELYDEFSTPEDALSAINDPENKFSEGQRRLLQALQKEDWLGFDYPHQAVQAAIREPENVLVDAPETRAALNTFGNKYTVSLNVEPEDLLDWDKPLSEQSEKVRKSLVATEEALKSGDSGQSILAKIEQAVMQAQDESAPGTRIMERSSSRAASEFLQSIGIKGIRFLDQGSRNIPDVRVVEMLDGKFGVLWGNDPSPVQSNGKRWFKTKAEAEKVAQEIRNPKTYNYVIFSDDDITITHENGQEVGARDMFSLEGGDMFGFDAPESVAEQKAREKREAETQKLKKAKDAMQERAGARLIGKDLDTTQEMFGAEVKRDKTGQGGLFERGPEYTIDNPALRGVASAYDIAPETAAQILNDPKAYQQEFGIVDPLLAGTVQSSKSSGPDGGQQSSSASGPDGGLTADSLRTHRAADFKRDFERGPLISSINPDKVSSQAIPTYNVNGQIIASPADFARTLLAVRSPYNESLKVVILDDQNVVQHSETLYAGSLDGLYADSRDLLRLFEKHSARGRRMMISHNHPSGVVTPSAADIKVTDSVQRAAKAAGFDIVDHVITNGDEFYSFASQQVMPLDGSPLANWEVLPRKALQHTIIDDNQKLAALVKELRQGNNAFAHVIYLNTRSYVTAIERISGKDANFQQRVVRGISREGAMSVLIDFGPTVSPHPAATMVRMINNATGGTSRVVDFAAQNVMSGRFDGYISDAPGGDKFSLPKTEETKARAAEATRLMEEIAAAEDALQQAIRVAGNSDLRKEQGLTKQAATNQKNLATARLNELTAALNQNPVYAEYLMTRTREIQQEINSLRGVDGKITDPQRKAELESEFEGLNFRLSEIPKKLVSRIYNEKFMSGDELTEREKAAGNSAPGTRGTAPAVPIGSGEIAPESQAQRIKVAVTHFPQTMQAAKRNAVHATDKLAHLWSARSNRDMMAATFDAAENGGALFGKQASNEVLHQLNRNFNTPAEDIDKRNPVREAALTFVIESGLNEETLREMRDLIQASEFSTSKQAKQALAAIDFAEQHWDRLHPVAELYGKITDAQVDHEQAAGVETLHRKGGYVFHMTDVAAMNPLPDLGGAGGVVASPFLKTRDYATYADAIAAGQVPKSLNAVDLLQRRMTLGQKLINHGAWVDGMFRVLDPKTQTPIVTHTITKVRQDGKQYEDAPSGYVKMTYGPQTFAVMRGYDGLFRALVTPGTVRNSLPGKILMESAGTIKHSMLLFDSYHLGRLMFWSAMVRGMGLPGNPLSHRQGLTLLDNTIPEIERMAAQDEIPKDWAVDLIESKRQLNLLVKNGLNVAGVADNIAPHFIQELPGIGTFNKFLFQKYQRGATAEAGLIELRRQLKQNPGVAEDVVARQVAKDLNTRFGNLQNQSWIKNKNMAEIMRMFFLAPQWNESLIRSEIRAARELGGSLKALTVGDKMADGSRQRHLRMGLLGRAVITAVIGQFLANQILNWITRGKPTWENEEETDAAKLSAYIPDVVGNGPGYFLNPLTLPAEISELLLKKTERTGDFTQAAKQFLASRLGPLGRVPYTLATREDELGAKLKTGNEVIGQMASSLLPIPISAGSVYRFGKQMVSGEKEEAYPGQFQRQLFQTFGVKLDSAPTADQRLRTLATRFNREKGITPSAEFFHGDYYDLDRAAIVGNERDMRNALELVLQRKTKDDIRKHYERWVKGPFTGNAARETEFKRTLNAEQLEKYEQARAKRRELQTAIMKMVNDASARSK